jgi:hypothetical protein
MGAFKMSICSIECCFINIVMAWLVCFYEWLLANGDKVIPLTSYTVDYRVLRL